MVLNCHTQNAQSIIITLDQINGTELSHSECATYCYYIDKINGAHELSHSQCVTNFYYIDHINGAELSHSKCTANSITNLPN